MNEERTSTSPTGRSWLEKLGQALSGEPKDRIELIELLRDAQQRQLLDVDALMMIEGVMQVTEMQVRDIMVPRAQMVVLEQDASLEEVLPVIAESGHSRFPIIGENRDEVVGLLLAKDLLPYFINGQVETFNLRDVLRPVVFVPESKRLNVLLQDFRGKRNHMAIIVDEYSGVAGLATIEDVVEQIVGEISDEHDVDEDIFIKQRDENNFVIKALTPVDEFNAFFKSTFSDEEFDTIGGHVMQAFGRMPKRDEMKVIGGFAFKILSADSRRLHWMEIDLNAQIDGEFDEDATVVQDEQDKA